MDMNAECAGVEAEQYMRSFHVSWCQAHKFNTTKSRRGPVENYQNEAQIRL